MQKDFIRNKIAELESAIFYNISEAPKFVNANIVYFLHIDDEGHLYFYTWRPDVLIDDDLRFPGILEFYRKGKPFCIKIRGVADLIIRNSDVPEKRDLVLVKFNVKHIEYTEMRKPSTNLLNRLRAFLFSWA